MHYQGKKVSQIPLLMRNCQLTWCPRCPISSIKSPIHLPAYNQRPFSNDADQRFGTWAKTSLASTSTPVTSTSFSTVYPNIISAKGALIQSSALVAAVAAAGIRCNSHSATVKIEKEDISSNSMRNNGGNEPNEVLFDTSLLFSSIWAARFSKTTERLRQKRRNANKCYKSCRKTVTFAHQDHI